MKILNFYFFGEEHISLYDALCFYGGIAAMILIALITLL